MCVCVWCVCVVCASIQNVPQLHRENVMERAGPKFGHGEDAASDIMGSSTIQIETENRWHFPDVFWSQGNRGEINKTPIS